MQFLTTTSFLRSIRIADKSHSQALEAELLFLFSFEHASTVSLILLFYDVFTDLLSFLS